MLAKFWRVFPWLISVGEFIIIIYILVNWVNKLPEPEAVVEVKKESNPIATETAKEQNPKTDSRFKVGDLVALTVNTNLRDKPAGELIQTLSKDETLELTEGPIVRKEAWWWKTKVSSTSAEKADLLMNLTGYISEGYWLRKK